MSQDSSNLSKPHFSYYLCCSLDNFKNLIILFWNIWVIYGLCKSWRSSVWFTTYRKLFAIRDPESLDSIPGHSCFNKILVILFLFLPVLSWYTESHHGIQINSLYWNHLKVIKNQIIISKCFIFVKTLFLYVAVTIRFTNKNSSAMSACVIFFFSCFLWSAIFRHLFMYCIYNIKLFFSRSLCRAEKYT